MQKCRLHALTPDRVAGGFSTRSPRAIRHAGPLRQAQDKLPGRFPEAAQESGRNSRPEESTVTNLSLKEVLALLDAPTMAGEPWQLERLRKWVEGLVTTRGQEYVRKNRHDLLTQCEHHAKRKFKSCV
jgi:hypothetical protein